jgi:hypothetical protein
MKRSRFRLWQDPGMGMGACYPIPYLPQIRASFTRLTQSRASMRGYARSSRRGASPSDEAATKLIWLALRNMTTNWMCRPRLETGDEPVLHSLRRSF